jgi:hypothetical protein
MAEGSITGLSFLVTAYCGRPSTRVKLTLTVLSGDPTWNDRVLQEKLKAEIINRLVMAEKLYFIF